MSVVILDYVEVVMRRAEYELMMGDEGRFGFVPGFNGLWGPGDSREECRTELRSTLWDWLSFDVDDLDEIWG